WLKTATWKSRLPMLMLASSCIGWRTVISCEVSFDCYVLQGVLLAPSLSIAGNAGPVQRRRQRESWMMLREALRFFLLITVLAVSSRSWTTILRNVDEAQRHHSEGTDLFGIDHVHARIAEVVVRVDCQRSDRDGES
ncbi:hypothetical protein ASPFODRAFT_127339, partial [Aspergillus luchuensis CBS 106.47]